MFVQGCSNKIIKLRCPRFTVLRFTSPIHFPLLRLLEITVPCGPSSNHLRPSEPCSDRLGGQAAPTDQDQSRLKSHLAEQACLARHELPAAAGEMRPPLPAHRQASGPLLPMEALSLPVRQTKQGAWLPMPDKFAAVHQDPEAASMLSRLLLQSEPSPSLPHLPKQWQCSCDRLQMTAALRS